MAASMRGGVLIQGYDSKQAGTCMYTDTRPEAECDTAGLTQIPGRIPFLQGG